MSKAQFRILMLLTVVSGLVGGGVVSWLFPGRAVFAQGTAPKVIEAQKFRVVDGQGKHRAWFGLLTDGGPILVLADAAGKSRVELSLRNPPEHGPLLALYDATGQGRAWLSLLPDGQLDLGMSNAAGQQRAWLGLSQDGEPSLALSDAAGEQRAGLGLSQDGSPSLVLCDAWRNARAVVGCTETVVIRSGVERKHPESTITLFKENGDVLWRAP